MLLTNVQLILISGIDVDTAEKWIGPLNNIMEQCQINTCLRVSAFLSQILHESGNFRWVREIWGPTAAQAGYEGRADLGNTQPGDGHKFLGRGLIQVTGRANYEACGKALGLDLVNNPELLEEPIYAVASAGWYWLTHHINEVADTDNIIAVTKKVNGGTNGLDKRTALYNAAKQQLFC